MPVPPPRLLALLLLLTAVTGCVDAVSFLRLEHVFTANMTGNVVLLGFAFGGASDLSVVGSLLSLAGFLAGAYLGGQLVRTRGAAGGRPVVTCLALQSGIVAVLALVLAVADPERHEGVRLAVTGLLALAMALQVSAGRYLAVPGVTTVVATTTLHGFFHETGLHGRPQITWVLPVGIVLALIAGAAIGAAAIQLATWVGLGIAAVVLAALTFAAARDASGQLAKAA